jgi:16S rRNA (cytosine1402-N4)-methyltransferase
MSVSSHKPVMLAEVLSALSPKAGGLYVDGTFGGGGYSSALLEAADCKVYAIDRDPDAIARGADAVRRFCGRLTLIEGRFGEMEQLLSAHDVRQADGVTLDVGVSSDQIDTPARGFSFQSDGPLDMRMGQNGPTAADVVNDFTEEEIARILFVYGEERRSRAIAKAICQFRDSERIERTSTLAALCHKVLGRTYDGIHPATRTFQALRIYVNDELGELLSALSAAERLLKPQGRLAVVSFHSLEDRIVKRFFAQRSGRAAAPSRHLPAPGKTAAPSFKAMDKGAVKPGAQEVSQNSRARSARLRAAERTHAPPIPLDAQILTLVPEMPQ